MGAMSDMIKAVDKDYAEESIERVRELCQLAGVPYRSPKEAGKLLADLNSKGYVLRMSKFSEPDVVVGQYLILRKLSGEIVKGFKVYVDFQDDYMVKVTSVYHDSEIVPHETTVFH